MLPKIFSDDELQEKCATLSQNEEVSKNEDAVKLLSLIADRVEQIGANGARDIIAKCRLETYSF